MKKIILAIFITASFTASADISFNFKNIPQPDNVVTDWDGDGIPNSEDNDDDNDGILDVNDSEVYTGSGKNSYVAPTPECQGTYTSGMVIGDMPFTYATINLTGGVPTNIVDMTWDAQSISIPNSSNVPVDAATGISSGGYTYWYNSEDVQETGFAMLGPDGMGGWVESQTIYYGLCRVAQ